MELKHAIQLFLSEQRPTTSESYRHPLKRMCDFFGPSRLITTIKPADLAEYRQHLETLRVNGNPYAPATMLKHIKTLKVFFNRMAKMEVIDRSPAFILKQKRLPTYVSRDKAMTDQELAVLLDFVKRKPRDYALLLFIADTGCRISGAAGLTIGELDLENRRAWVEEKGDKRRQVAYGDLCARAVIQWLIARPKTAGQFVFSRTAGSMKADNISLMIRRTCKQVGIRVLSGHSLRHRKGHQLADQRTAPSIAATALGHSDPTITLRHYYPADWESAERELQKLVATEALRPALQLPPINLIEQLKRLKTSGT